LPPPPQQSPLFLKILLTGAVSGDKLQSFLVSLF
jgi:hypothetical protein